MRSLGAIGTTALLAGVAGCLQGGDGDGEGDGEGETEETTPGETTEGGGDGEEWEQTDTVDMNDELRFVPERIQVSSGTEVTWENVGSLGHTVTAYEDEIPDDAEYFASGGFDSEEAARDGYPDEGNVTEGESYSHTFETTGTYKYLCIPHELNGMVGFVKVT